MCIYSVESSSATFSYVFHRSISSSLTRSSRVHHVVTSLTNPSSSSSSPPPVVHTHAYTAVRSLGRSQRKPNSVLHGQSRRRHGAPETLHADVHGAGVIRRQRRPVVTDDGRVCDGGERERVGVTRPPPTWPSDNRHLSKKHVVIPIAHTKMKINLPTQLCRSLSSSATPRLRTGWRAARGGRR